MIRVFFCWKRSWRSCELRKASLRELGQSLRSVSIHKLESCLLECMDVLFWARNGSMTIDPNAGKE